MSVHTRPRDEQLTIIAVKKLSTIDLSVKHEDGCLLRSGDH